MHDTLDYFRRDPIHRRYHHHQLTFSLMYAFSENFILPLSHDEVVHGKGSLLSKMPGDRWQQFANLRSLYAYMWAHPGKKLLFMGGELAQEREWSHDRSLDWHLLEQPEHAGMQQLVRTLNRVYREHPALWEVDHEPAGFRWLEPNDAARQRPRLRALRARRDAAARLRLQPLAGGARGLPRRLPRRRPLGRGAEHRLDATTAAATSATSAASRPSPTAGTTSRSRRSSRCRRSRSAGSCPSPSRPSPPRRAGRTMRRRRRAP